MDSHVHIVGNDSKGEESIADSSHMGTVWGVVNAEKTLMAGFTTVRNVGAANYADVSVRDAIERGVINGPTMLVSGPALGITGHCDQTYYHQNLTIQVKELSTALGKQERW